MYRPSCWSVRAAWLATSRCLRAKYLRNFPSELSLPFCRRMVHVGDLASHSLVLQPPISILQCVVRAARPSSQETAVITVACLDLTDRRFGWVPVGVVAEATGVGADIIKEMAASHPTLLAARLGPGVLVRALDQTRGASHLGRPRGGRRSAAAGGCCRRAIEGLPRRCAS